MLFHDVFLEFEQVEPNDSAALRRCAARLPDEPEGAPR